VDLCEFKASLVYRVSFRTARATERKAVLKTKTKPTNQTNKQKKQMKKAGLNCCCFLTLSVCYIPLCRTRDVLGLNVLKKEKGLSRKLGR